MNNDGVNFVGWFLLITLVVTAMGFSVGNFIQDRKQIEYDHIYALRRLAAGAGEAGAPFADEWGK